MENEKSNLPTEVLKYIDDTIEARTKGLDTPVTTIDNLFSGDKWAGVKDQLTRDGIAEFTGSDGEKQFMLVDRDSTGAVTAVAAAIPRRAGRAEAFLKDVADFKNQSTDRNTLIELYRQIYRKEGIVNNAIQKASGLIATEGAFKIRYVKGQRGKGADKRAEELRMILQFWVENLNNRALEGVKTGARGVNAFISQGVRQALIEGDHVARMTWKDVNVPQLNTGFSLPIIIQSIPGDHLTIPTQLQGSGLEFVYWKPPRNFIEMLKNPPDKNIAPLIKNAYSSDVVNALVKDGQYPLDQDLLLHVKHRGTDADFFGESFIEPALSDIAYKRALQALDIVTIENLINRLVIVKVGSDNDKSVYHKQEVTNRRVTKLQELMRRIGPSALIIWAGPDIDVISVGAHDQILAMDERYKQAQGRIKEALGVSSSLLTGEGSDGKAAGISSHVGLAAQLKELQDQYKMILTSVAELIAVENGFEDVNVVWEFHQSLLVDKTENANIMLGAYDRGLIPTPTAIEELGLSFEAVEAEMADDVAKGYRDEMFGPPKVAMTTNPGGTGGETGGRPPKKTKPGKRDPRENKETNSPQNNNNK